MRASGLDNEVNLGLGLNYTIHEDARGVGFAEAGVYRDSGRYAAKIAGALVGVHSDIYNRGRFFVAPLPILTCDFGPVALNAIYVPRYRDYNQFAVFGFYLSLPLGQ